MCPNSMIKQLTGEYVSLVAKEFFTVHRTVKATSGFSIIQALLTSHMISRQLW